jgi:hypothetical protein
MTVGIRMGDVHHVHVRVTSLRRIEKERERERLCIRTQSTEIVTMLRLSLFLTRPSSSSTCRSTRMCWEVVVVIITVAGAQNKKKKGQQKCARRKRPRPVPTCVWILMSPPLPLFYLQQKRTFFFYFCFVQISLCTQLLCLMVYATFNWYRVILPHLSYIFNEYAHTRVAKATIYYLGKRAMTYVCH